MRNLTKLTVVAAAAFAIASSVAQASPPSVADLDAAARAVGNQRDLAERIGLSVFATPWAAEVSQISANSIEGHLIVGIRIWGVKFHSSITREQFVDEVVGVVERAFAAAPATEEVDVWASIPIAIPKGEIVSGDLAKPTTRTVFSLTVRRGESAASLRARAAVPSADVFWDPQWAHDAFKESS